MSPKTQLFLSEIRRASAEQRITLQCDALNNAVSLFLRTCAEKGQPNDATIRAAAQGFVKSLIENSF